jgi:hypothetical protein
VRLRDLANSLKISASTAEDIEREVMGDIVEAVI